MINKLLLTHWGTQVIAIHIVWCLSGFVHGDDILYTISFTKGVFHGPGRMPDAPMPEGYISHIKFYKPLFGETPYFNNGAAKPNLTKKTKFLNIQNGFLSDGMPFNEYMDGGVVSIGMGALRLLTVVSSIGPNKGRQIYQLDENKNWIITSDLALDPGFPEGMILINNIKITTGVVWAPKSVQTQNSIPGGVDLAGSLKSGTPMIGRLGDYDMDGYLDGIVVGQSNVPLGHLFTPGAPVVQLRSFVSNIPVSNEDSAFLMLSSILNYKAVIDSLLFKDSQTTDKNINLTDHIFSKYITDINYRFLMAKKLLNKSNNMTMFYVDQLEIGITEIIKKYIKTKKTDIENKRNEIHEIIEVVEKFLNDVNLCDAICSNYEEHALISV